MFIICGVLLMDFHLRFFLQQNISSFVVFLHLCFFSSLVVFLQIIVSSFVFVFFTCGRNKYLGFLFKIGSIDPIYNNRGIIRHSCDLSPKMPKYGKLAPDPQIFKNLLKFHVIWVRKIILPPIKTKCFQRMIKDIVISFY